MTINRPVRIGAGCSVDIALSLPQMVRGGNVDYIVIDFMTEVAVSNMKAADMSAAGKGFGTGLVGPELERELAEMMRKNIKLVTNAGGLHPMECADALRKMAEGLGLSPRIAVVMGDDVLEAVQQNAGKYTDMFNGEPVPDTLISANAYLGAKPVAEALAMGADIVITGRVVDSALIVGPLIHEFNWAMDDYDTLANGVLIGHLLECGPQPAGGTFTDWREVDFSNISFPIAECYADGTAVFTKVEGTGGKISVGTISEQILYEIGDPQKYAMPEVMVDLSNVKVEALENDTVRVSGAKGLPPSGKYKVFGLVNQGWRAVVSGIATGRDAAEKAQLMGDAIITRTERMLRANNLGELKRSAVQVIGAGASQGAQMGGPVDTREAVFRVLVDHDEKEAVDIMTRLSSTALVSMAPGTSVGNLGAPIVSPQMKMSAFLMDADLIPAKIVFEGDTHELTPPVPAKPFTESMLVENAPMPVAEAIEGVTVPLDKVAWLRSGDKGDKSNVGVIARDAAYLPYINASMTNEAVAKWLAHLLTNPDAPKIERYELPGMNALNFLIDEALDGGAVMSTRFDIMGKGVAQQMVDFPVTVPAELAKSLI